MLGLRNGKITGAFAFYETHGVPLDLIVDHLRTKGLDVDFDDFQQAALAAGMNPRSIKIKINDCRL